MIFHPTQGRIRADFWLDKSVFLNYTLAKDPPSVGLVTFDGLDRRGDVYDIVTGVGDRLTSKAIDLSSYTANSNVFLRFFLSPKGYGLPPNVTDNMVLEFRNANRQWVTVGTYDGTGNVPIDSLTLETAWDVQTNYIKFTERYRNAAGEVVKESAHVYAPNGLLAQGVAAQIG